MSDGLKFQSICPKCGGGLYISAATIQTSIDITPGGWAFGDAEYMDTSDETVRCHTCDYRGGLTFVNACRCDNCGGTFKPDELLAPPKNLWARLEPGDIVPDGECPKCGALYHHQDEEG